MMRVDKGSFRTRRIDLQGPRKKFERCGTIMILDLEIRPKSTAEQSEEKRPDFER
jgi:hypothetical protein